MTPQEERLVVELHAKWGNRWSRIARKLPGRTDNEIKNYWRTHTRKKAQEKKRAASPSSSSSTKSCSSSSNITAVESVPFPKTGVESFYDTGGNQESASKEKIEEKQEEEVKGYSMDDIWKEMNLPEVDNLVPFYDGYAEENCNFSSPLIASPSWEYCSDSLWNMDEEESKIFFPTSDHFTSCFEYGGASLTG